ncbi:hypothetical protein SDC9_115509 [bioreactor metagenome]|uniref:Uncharacterized protein n=1 Tax=bioreactor metagenome TaxID=1076179 RepID=A0A645BTC3_9ZZZZ
MRFLPPKTHTAKRTASAVLFARFLKADPASGGNALSYRAPPIRLLHCDSRSDTFRLAKCPGVVYYKNKIFYSGGVLHERRFYLCRLRQSPASSGGLRPQRRGNLYPDAQGGAGRGEGFGSAGAGADRLYLRRPFLSGTPAARRGTGPFNRVGGHPESGGRHCRGPAGSE